MAQRKDSQLEVDAVKPNTIGVARLYRLSVRKPNALVRSAWILANQKQALMSARYYECRITDSCIVDINVDLEFYMAKSHR